MKQKILSLLVLLLTAASGAWADETPIVTITATGSGPAYSVEGIVTLETGGAGYGAGYGWVSGPANNLTVTAADGVTITKVKFIGNQGGSWEDTESPFQVLLQGFYVKNASGTKIGSDDGVISIEVYGTIAPAGPEVTFNDAKTEASFDMPTSDVTIDYELVRDMAVSMTTTMGDGTDGERYRVKKSEQNPGKYEPADMDIMQVVALVAVNDGIEQKALTLNQDYFCRIYKLDEQTQQPDGDGVLLADFDFAPGLYALKAFANNGSSYDGETALSNTFVLFEGYEVEVPAGEYITYYKDEALYVEDTEAKLYTITAVSGTTATADELTIAPANTPILVKNNGSETKTILLIPTTTDTPDNVTPYEGFTGTLEAATIAASDATQDNYAWNGLQFVWVKTALSIAANKAWLQVPATASAPQRIQIVFSSTTGIGAIDGLQSEGEGAWYDLNGRRLPGKPTKKGVYILNGKKMVVK